MQATKKSSRAATAIDTEDWIVLNEAAQPIHLLVMIPWKQKPKFLSIGK